MTKLKAAIVTAESLCVACPHCAEPLPSKDNGSEMRLPIELSRRNGEKVTCNACNENFFVSPQSKVSVIP